MDLNNESQGGVWSGRAPWSVPPVSYLCGKMWDMDSAAQKRREVGALGESIAAQYLQRKGFKILERNYRKPWGEIDIIAEKGGVVRFVEVKTVSRESSGSVTREIGNYRPEEMAHEGKLRKVARTAELYMNDREDDRDFQVDVVGVVLDARTRRAQCRLFEQVL